MADQQSRADTFEKFTWKIENFSHLDSNKLYSHTVVIEGQPWRILLFPRGNKVNYLSIYLSAVNSDKLPSGWTRDVKFKLTVFNQVNSNMSITRDTSSFAEAKRRFNATKSEWGFTSFMPLGDLHDPCKGFLVKDTCIIGAEVSVTMPKQEEQVNQDAVLSQSGHKELALFSASSGDDELVDFLGLGKIEKAFVPLLVEVCSKHSSLIECQKKRSPRFTEWAFTALGRVLYFLKTRKVKDMNQAACKDLESLWEELETFKFDLSWLKPHVQFALRMESYVEKVLGAEKLKENVVALESEMKVLEVKLAAAKADLDRVSYVLEEEGFHEIDLDVELGYGIGC